MYFDSLGHNIDVLSYKYELLCHNFEVVSHNKDLTKHVYLLCVFHALYRHSDKSVLSVSADDKLKQ